jgi:NAD(P)-dependent dehydrogenase (short-subunit alcohol dehydrogenase family)
MRALGGGSIINMSSGAWVGGVSELETYSAAKAAIVGLTNSLARSVGRDRIRVNALVPGMIFTERQRRLWFKDESQVTAGLARQCIPEEVTGADCAQAALLLASDASRMITKQFLMVNGGLR